MTTQRTTTRAGRFYTDKDGNKYWSVTTIIGGGVPKPALPRWASKSAAEWAVANLEEITMLPPGEAIARIKEAPWKYAEARADIGTRVHEAIEAYVLDKPMPGWDADVAPYMAQFERFLVDWKPRFEASELSVFNRTEAYAGALDFIAHIPALGPGLQIGDVKTGKGVYPEVSLQLAAYRHAEFIETKERVQSALPQIDGGVVLHIAPDKYELIPVECGEPELMVFKYAREIFRFQSEHSKTVIGRALNPAAVQGVMQ
jgi:hypothetical protein